MLVTLDDMKNYLGIPLVDTTYDAFLTEQITVISDSIENYCGRKFALGSYTQTFYYDDFRTIKKELYLFHYPVTSVTSIEENDEALVPVEDYRVANTSGKIVKPRGFFSYAGNVEVIYEAGYATIPSIIQHVVKSLVSEKYNKKVAGVDLGFGPDVQQISIPGTINVSFDYTLQSNERKNAFGMILGNYLNVLDSFRSERSLLGTIEGGEYVS